MDIKLFKIIHGNISFLKNFKLNKVEKKYEHQNIFQDYFERKIYLAI